MGSIYYEISKWHAFWMFSVRKSVAMKNFIFLPVILLVAVSCTVERPYARFTASSNVIEAGDAVTFTNLSRNADFAEWDFGDGYVSNAFDAVHVYDRPGNYTVTLTVFSHDHFSDQTYMNITVLYPTVLEITVREYYNQYLVPNASVILYPTLNDWVQQTNAVCEGYTGLDGRVVFSRLYPAVYYVDVWEENHNNYLLAEKDVGFIRTLSLVPNAVNTFTAYVDYVGGSRKSETLRSAGTRPNGRKANTPK